MSQSFAKRSRSRKRRSRRQLPKPGGVVDCRVQAAGPEHFGVVSVDCAKHRSRWMLCDFYGRVLLPAATVEHCGSALRHAVDALRGAVREHRLTDLLVAVERTGNYHRPVQRAFRDAGYETRVVHPLASSQFRQIEHPGDKTDDHDLFGIHRATVVGFGLLELPLDDTFLHLQQRTIDKIIGWAGQAAAADDDALVRQRILCDLDDDRIAKRRLISRVELDIAGLLAETPYVLLMAIPGINVVSAGELAGEAGPIAHYANPNAITGRAGLFPSRYQSDQVDVNGRLVRCGNRRLRAALLLIADNLPMVNNYFRAQGALWKQNKVNPRLQRVRVAKRFSRLAFLMLAGRRIVPHACCRDPHYILDKLLGFHLEHDATHAQLREQLAAASSQLPDAARDREARALRNSAARFETARKPQLQSLGAILKEVLANRFSLTVQSAVEV
jgi:transposase